MARCVMTSLPLTVLLAFSLSFTFVSTLSDKQREKLDEIEQLLLRLQNEIYRMRSADNGRHITQQPSVSNATDDYVINGSNYDNTTELSYYDTSENRTDEDYDFRNLTTPLETGTTRSMKDDSYTTNSYSTREVIDSATSISGEETGSRGGQEVTTGPSHTTALPEIFQSTGPLRSWVTQTDEKHQTPGEKNHDKDKEDKDKGEEGEKEKDKEEENELRDVQNVRRLIDEGEDLERQLKGVFLQLRSLSQCAPVGDKCGVHEGQTKCCKGLKCSSNRSGTCQIDCVPLGQSCSENFFCCPKHQCVKSVDRNGENTYVCQ